MVLPRSGSLENYLASCRTKAPTAIESQDLVRWMRPERSRHPLQRRSLPLSVQRLGFRPVEPHDNEERSLRRGKPVRLLVGTGRLVLEVEGKPAVDILFELRDHRRVQQIPIETIGYHQLRGEIVHGHRPERAYGRQLIRC